MYDITGNKNYQEIRADTPKQAKNVQKTVENSGHWIL